MYGSDEHYSLFFLQNLHFAGTKTSIQILNFIMMHFLENQVYLKGFTRGLENRFTTHKRNSETFNWSENLQIHSVDM